MDETTTFLPAVRKLRAEHFAFMRAYVQGLDLRDVWERYLGLEGDHADLRVVRRTVSWLRDAFAAAAHRHSRPGVARLLRIEVPGRIALTKPSLEEFAVTCGLQDFSYEEQVARYEETHGLATMREKRAGRLILRQLEAISWLEQVAADSPHPEDGIRAWLPSELADRLEEAGMFTLQQLVERINGVGRNWHASSNKIGAVKANRIVALLQSFPSQVGLAVGQHLLHAPSRSDISILESVVARTTGIVPLEKFIVPDHLDGRFGKFRKPRSQCCLEADCDFDALIEFLREKEEGASKRPVRSSNPSNLAWLKELKPTTRAYFIECQRFMLWAILVRGKPLSSIDEIDAIAYSEFIRDPQPAALWCGPRSRRRWGPAWRPFEGPLNPAAQRRALTMLGTLYRYLVSRQYIAYSPWTSCTKPRVTRAEGTDERSFNKEEWALICQQLAVLPSTSANLRLRFALPLLYGARLRRSEVVRARVGDIIRTKSIFPKETRPLIAWQLHVEGKNGRHRLVPLAQAHVDALCAYLKSRGLSTTLDDPRNADVFLLGQVTDLSERAPWAAVFPMDPRHGIGAQTLYDQIKAFFVDCAKAVAAADPTRSKRLQRASTFWLRHTGSTHSLAAGTPVEVEMEVAGHATFSTVCRYVRVDAGLRLEQCAAFATKQRSFF